MFSLVLNCFSCGKVEVVGEKLLLLLPGISETLWYLSCLLLGRVTAACGVCVLFLRITAALHGRDLRNLVSNKKLSDGEGNEDGLIWQFSCTSVQ